MRTAVTGIGGNPLRIAWNLKTALLMTNHYAAVDFRLLGPKYLQGIDDWESTGAASSSLHTGRDTMVVVRLRQA